MARGFWKRLGRASSGLSARNLTWAAGIPKHQKV